MPPNLMIWNLKPIGFGGSYQSRYHHTQRFGNWDGLNPGVSEFHRARLPFQAVQKTAADSSLEKGEDEEGEDAAIGAAPIPNGG